MECKIWIVTELAFEINRKECVISLHTYIFNWTFLCTFLKSSVMFWVFVYDFEEDPKTVGITVFYLFFSYAVIGFQPNYECILVQHWMTLDFICCSLLLVCWVWNMLQWLMHLLQFLSFITICCFSFCKWNYFNFLSRTFVCHNFLEAQN